MKKSQKLFRNLRCVLDKIDLRSVLPKSWQRMPSVIEPQLTPAIEHALFVPDPLPEDANSKRKRLPRLRLHDGPLARTPRRKARAAKSHPGCPPRLRTETAISGQFLSSSYSNLAGSRDYKLYIPSCYRGQALPLVVMLHGCRQNPDDFAAGTRMNLIAEQNQCLVLYPAQSGHANKWNCWNWFRPANQQRDGEEPSLIAGITREVITTYRLDRRRVYIAGLSSGGAMAGIMGAVYPDLYAAVGIHSGMPYAGINSVITALAAMKTGRGSLGPHLFLPFAGLMAPTATIPVIVFHGDQDATVHPRNGDRVMAQHGQPASLAHAVSVTEQLQQLPGGHAYTRRILRNSDGAILAEQWLVHGSGHAWSGGSDRGSYADPRGPDAASEMLRFFYLHMQQP